jgi:hypothetical protein
MFYDPKNNQLMVGGKILSGIDVEAGINVERSNDAVSHKIGMAGEISFTLSPDKSGTITFSIKNTNKADLAFLAGLHKTQMSSGATIPAMMKGGGDVNFTAVTDGAMFQNWIEPNLEQEEGSTEVVLIGNIESGWL